MKQSLGNTLWHSLLGFSYFYPLFMAYLWMLGASIFHWRNESDEPAFDQPEHRTDAPPVSVLVPCFNESDNVEETLLHALALDYPEFEVIAINDGSHDNTGAILDQLATQQPRLRVVHLAHNQGKAKALEAGCLLAQHDILICIDGDALLDAHAAHWLSRHFVRFPEVAAVTGNPRIRNRSTLLGRVQVGEFSSIIGMIKRAQRTFGKLFTVSGVITAFRRSALHHVGYWSADALTEDIDITWKLHRAGWDVRFEPHALTWILMPETLQGLWKQRLRWAMGGAQVLLRNLDVFCSWRQIHLWPLMLELCLSLLWANLMALLIVIWLAGLLLPAGIMPAIASPLIPQWSSLLLGFTCLLQFAFSKWMDSRYDRGLGRNYYWMIWYPLVFWMINMLCTVVAFPKVLRRDAGLRARWNSPDRGVRP